MLGSLPRPAPKTIPTLTTAVLRGCLTGRSTTSSGSELRDAEDPCRLHLPTAWQMQRAGPDRAVPGPGRGQALGGADSDGRVYLSDREAHRVRWNDLDRLFLGGRGGLPAPCVAGGGGPDRPPRQREEPPDSRLHNDSDYVWEAGAWWLDLERAARARALRAAAAAVSGPALNLWPAFWQS